MIIIEFLQACVRRIAQFVVWVITARDCNHCKYDGCCEYTHHGWDMRHECLGSIARINFVRKKKEADNHD